MTDADETTRTFKTAWFSKAARKARIKDDELCEAIREVMTIAHRLKDGLLVEICHGNADQV